MKAKKAERPLWQPFFPLENMAGKWEWHDVSSHTGWSVSDDETALAGMRAKELDRMFDKGILWSKADKKGAIADQQKTCDRKALTPFSYQIASETILRISCPKKTSRHAKTIPIQEG